MKPATHVITLTGTNRAGHGAPMRAPARFPLRSNLCLALVSLYVGTMKLSDNQIDDRLHAAMKLLEPQECETVAGRTAMEAARRALWLYGSALVQAGEHKRMREEDHDV